MAGVKNPYLSKTKLNNAQPLRRLGVSVGLEAMQKASKGDDKTLPYSGIFVCDEIEKETSRAYIVILEQQLTEAIRILRHCEPILLEHIRTQGYNCGCEPVYERMKKLIGEVGIR